MISLHFSAGSSVAYRSLATAVAGKSTSLERLSSGQRISRAADDAAGLAIAQGLTAQIRGLRMAERNTQDGISLLQTAEGALTETTAVLQRQRTLAVQAASTGSNKAESLSAIQAEFAQLNEALDGIARSTQYNGTPLLNGTFGGVVSDVGATRHTIFADMTPTSFGMGGTTRDRFVVTAGQNDDFRIGIDSGNPGALVFTVTVPPGEYAQSQAGAGALQAALQTSLDASPGAGIGRASVTYGPEMGLRTSIHIDRPWNSGSITGEGFHALTHTTDVTIRERGRIFQVGANAGDTLALSIRSGLRNGGFGSQDLGVALVDLRVAAAQAIDDLDGALSAVLTARSGLGAAQNRLDSIAQTQRITAENLSASLSRVADADVALEMAGITRQQILQESATAMLAQANAHPKVLLDLLRAAR